MRTPRGGVVAAVLGCMIVAGGCSPELLSLFGPRHPPPVPPETPAAVTADEEALPWAEKEPIFVVVRQSCRTLDVYRYGKRIRSYPAVFGQGGTPKLNEGDRRTPIALCRPAVSGRIQESLFDDLVPAYGI